MIKTLFPVILVLTIFTINCTPKVQSIQERELSDDTRIENDQS